jgi:hypothetical protein
MTPKHDLHELVHSLTEAELSAFRKEVLRRDGQHIYLQIFEALLEMVDYDEAKLKRMFKGKKTLNNFSIAKNNLYEKILEVLCELPHHQNIETRFDHFKQQITILIRKSLYKQALERVEKATRVAEKMEAFKRVFELQDLKREIGRHFLSPQDYLEMLRQLRTDETWVNEAEQNLNRYRDVFDTASIAQKFPPSVRTSLINSILGQEIMQDVSECRSVSAQIYFYRTWNHLYFIQGKTTGWRYFTEQLLSLLEKNPSLLSDPTKFLVYVNAISNIGYNSISLSEFANAMEAAEKLQTIRKELKTGENEALIFSRYWKLQILYYQKKLDEKNGMVAVEKVQEGLKRYKGKLSRNDSMELIHYVTVFLLCMGHNSEAIAWILKQRDEFSGQTRSDLHDFAWIFLLVAHFNLGNLDVVETQLSSTMRFFKDRKRPNLYFKAILTFFKKVINAKNIKETNDILQRLQNELEELIRQDGDASLLEYFNFMAWSESRIRNVPMREALQTWKIDFLEVPN